MIQKKIVILGGGANQIPLIQRARNLGLYVIVCDFRPDIDGAKIADAHYCVDTMDVDRVIDVCKKENVDGIITNSEPTFLPMAQVAREVGLRCLDVEDTELYKNKFKMREFCRNHGIDSPQYALCASLDDAITAYHTIGKKCIIKPLDNSASRGVFSIKSDHDLWVHFDECLSASSVANHHVLLEEYIEGTEFTIDSLKTNEGNRCLAISSKKHYAYNENVAFQLLFENNSNEYDYQLLRKANDYLVEATKIPFGLTHAEYKYSNGRFYLIEIQARGGGNYIATDIVPFMSGIDSYTEQILWAIGEDPNIDYSYDDLTSRCAVLHFFDVPNEGGKVQSIRGLGYFDSLKDKLQYELFFKPGDVISKAKDDAHRIGYYILKAENREELDTVMRNIDKQFQIVI
jgi:biotin carboxylase